ncbi:MAG: S-methyl-5-thioribose-1-phosphate isomerase [Zoogloeaceae bacterium]|nr:S-methyl-5-thioribose-1-phosphate isomerase [Zoogloeaceae bacterium]
MNCDDSCPTLQRDDDSILILDQTALPHQRTFVRLANLADAARAIRTMQVRGAPLIGATAAFGMALALGERTDDASLDAALADLAATRPTAVNLHWALGRMAKRLRPLAPSARREAAWAEAEAIQKEDAAQNAAIGRHGLPLIAEIASRRPGPVRVMTHCNAGWLATCGHGTALAPVYAAQAAGIPLLVWVSETRPRNQGLLTAWELAQSGIPFRLIADNAAGHLLSQGAVDLVITGADRVAANGDTANKIGTYLKALAAQDQGVPFYIAAPGSTLDFSCPNGAAIPIEDRTADEVLVIPGLTPTDQPGEIRLAAAGTPVANPAFDVTPARLITALITERGLVTLDRLGGLYPERNP